MPSNHAAVHSSGGPISAGVGVAVVLVRQGEAGRSRPVEGAGRHTRVGALNVHLALPGPPDGTLTAACALGRAAIDSAHPRR